jgi:hypothetical protein
VKKEEKKSQRYSTRIGRVKSMRKTYGSAREMARLHALATGKSAEAAAWGVVVLGAAIK